MKRVIMALLAIGLLCMALFGCSPKGKSSEEKLRESEEGLRESQEKLGETYAKIFEGFGEYSEAVEKSDGITEYEIEANIINQSDFDKLEEGMTYDETMNTLGAKINSIASDDDMFMCNWMGADGGFIIINFFDGKVSYLTASGLLGS